MARILPEIVSAPKDIQTAIQTRKLQRMPRKRASKKLRLALAAAVLMTESAMPSNSPLKTTRSVIIKAPIKLPRKTSPQFFNSFPSVISFLSREVIIRLLPVKSSLPAMTTIMSPTGKIQALTILPP